MFRNVFVWHALPVWASRSLGLMEPAKRWKRLTSNFEDSGVNFPEQVLEGVHPLRALGAGMPQEDGAAQVWLSREQLPTPMPKKGP